MRILAAACCTVIAAGGCNDNGSEALGKMDLSVPPSPAPDLATAPTVDQARPAGSDLAGAVDQAAPGDAAVAADTWDSFARQFFASYCTRCHGAGNMKRDYSQYAQVVRDAQLVRCGVSPDAVMGNCGGIAPGQFPIGNGPFPSRDERLRAVAWIEAGLPQ